MLTITLASAGACALINLWLGFRCGRVRMKRDIMVGDGGDEMLVRRMRAQANFVENAPFILILIALIEYSQGTSIVLAIVAALFVIARIAHPFGMDGFIPARMFGALVTMLLLLGLGLYAISMPVWAGNPLPKDGIESPSPSV